MKAYVKCEASGFLFVSVPLCSSASSPPPTSICAPLPLPGPSGVSQEQEEVRTQTFLGLQRIRLGQGMQLPRDLDGTSLGNRS